MTAASVPQVTPASTARAKPLRRAPQAVSVVTVIAAHAQAVLTALIALKSVLVELQHRAPITGNAKEMVPAPALTVLSGQNAL